MNDKNKASEDLKVILDLLGEWRNEYGYGYVTACVICNGIGNAYTHDKNGSGVYVSGNYGSRESETPAVGADGESM